MKRLLLVLLVWSHSAWAGVALDFQGLPVSQFAEVVIKGVLERDYVISGDLVASDKRLSMYVADVDKGRALEVVRLALDQFGVAIVERSGVLWLVKKADSERLERIEAYRPVYRDTEMLAAVAQFVGAKTMSVEGKGGQDVMLMSGDDGQIEKVMRALQAVDTKPQSVEVRGAVLEVTDSSGSKHSLHGLVSLFAGKVGLTVGGVTLANALTLKSSSLDVVLSAIKGDDRFRFVAEPRLRVSDGKIARVSVGQDVPVRGAVTLAENGSVLQSVEYRSSGVTLEVEPQIRDGHISARVLQEVSTVATNTSSGIDSPVLQKRMAETIVEASPGEVIVLAGMDQSTETHSESGLSFLPWMTSETKSQSRSQLLLLLEFTPIASEI